MKYGIKIAAGPAGDPRTMATFAALAEAAGWDGMLPTGEGVHPGPEHVRDLRATIAAQ